jgi:hypothetical protein
MRRFIRVVRLWWLMMLFRCILRIFGKFEIAILKEQTKELIEGNFFLLQGENNDNKNDYG